MGPVGASLSPHCLPASRLLPRVTSVHLPDFAHYHTIGPGMFPSSQIPSWKVCVSPPSPPLPPPSLTALCSPPLLSHDPHPDPPHPSLPHSAFLPIEHLSLRKFPLGRTKKQQADLRARFPHGAEMGEAPWKTPSLSPGRRQTQTGPWAVLPCRGPLHSVSITRDREPLLPRPRAPHFSPESLIGPWEQNHNPNYGLVHHVLSQK